MQGNINTNHSKENKNGFYTHNAFFVSKNNNINRIILVLENEIINYQENNIEKEETNIKNENNPIIKKEENKKNDGPTNDINILKECHIFMEIVVLLEKENNKKNKEKNNNDVVFVDNQNKDFLYHHKKSEKDFRNSQFVSFWFLFPSFCEIFFSFIDNFSAVKFFFHIKIWRRLFCPNLNYIQS